MNVHFCLLVYFFSDLITVIYLRYALDLHSHRLSFCRYKTKQLTKWTSHPPEAVSRRCSLKTCSYKFRKIHRKKSLPEPEPATLLKKKLWHRYFPVNFAKFLKTPFFIEHLWWLLLNPVLLSFVSEPRGKFRWLQCLILTA